MEKIGVCKAVPQYENVNDGIGILEEIMAAVKHLVTVVIPVFNTGEAIRAAIRSIRRQDYPNLEVLLVNDGSTDETMELAQSEICDDERFRIVNKENGGLSSARNRGLEEASGDLVIFWDSDDTQKENAISTLVDAMDSADADVACCGLTRIRFDRSKVDLFTGRREVVSSGQAMEMWLRGDRISTGAVTKLCKTEMLRSKAIRFVEGEVNEDVIWTAEVIDASFSIAVTGIPLYNYISHEGSLSNSFSPASLVVFDHCKQLMAFIREKYPRLRRVCDRYCAEAIVSVASEGSRGRSFDNFQEEAIAASRELRAFFPKVIATGNLRMIAVSALIISGLYRYLRY